MCKNPKDQPKEPFKSCLKLFENWNIVWTILSHENYSNVFKSLILGPKVKVKRDRDFIGIDMLKKAGSCAGQLCLWSSEADIGEEVSVKRTMLQEHANLKVFSNLLDAHFYIFEKWVLDFIAHDE